MISAHRVALDIQTRRLAIDVAGQPIYRNGFVAYHASKPAMPAMRAFWDFTPAEAANNLPETPRPPHRP